MVDRCGSRSSYMGPDDRLTGQLLLDLCCPFLDKTGGLDAAAGWIQGLTVSDERLKFLQWIFNLLGVQHSSLETGLMSLGLFTKEQDAKGFVDGGGKGERETWNALFSLLHTNSKFERSRDELLDELKRSDDFIDALAENVSFHDQLNKPIPILDYQMEKELAKLSSVSHPSKKILQTLLRKVEEEKENLSKDDNTSGTEEPGGSCLGTSLERFVGESGKLKTYAEEFNLKYNSDLKPVLKNKSTFEPVDTDQVSRMAEKSGALRRYLEGSLTTFNNINNIASIHNNIKKHSPDYSFM